MDGQHCSVLTHETDIPAAVSSEAPFTPSTDDRGSAGRGEIWYRKPTHRRRPRSNREHAAQLSQLSSDLGFTAFAFLSLHPSTDEGAGDSLQGYATDIPAPWKATYEHGGLHRHDPIVAVGRLKREIFSWDAEDPDLSVTDSHRSVMDEMQAHNLCRGIAAPVHGPQGELSVLMLWQTIGKRTSKISHSSRARRSTGPPFQATPPCLTRTARPPRRGPQPDEAREGMPVLDRKGQDQLGDFQNHRPNRNDGELPPQKGDVETERLQQVPRRDQGDHARAAPCVTCSTGPDIRHFDVETRQPVSGP